jgi:(2Fe-2S) ferredoxin
MVKLFVVANERVNKESLEQIVTEILNNGVLIANNVLKGFVFMRIPSI